MTRLTATTRPVDESRVHRMIVAWLDGDRLALDTVLGEAMRDPVGVPGLVFALTGFAAEIGEQAAPDLVPQLRAALLAAADDEEP